MWPRDAGSVLLPMARAAIAERLGVAGPRTSTGAGEQWLTEAGASFVTLHSGGRLRGCIGTISAYRTLVDDVRGNAFNAAFRDPRFQPVTRREYAEVDLEVSLLSPPEPLVVSCEPDLLEQLRPGADGLLLEAGSHRATFLPQVWEQLPEPRDFVDHLKAKAGVGQVPWASDWRVSRYTVTAWSE